MPVRLYQWGVLRWCRWVYRWNLFFGAFNPGGSFFGGLWYSRTCSLLVGGLTDMYVSPFIVLLCLFGPSGRNRRSSESCTSDVVRCCDHGALGFCPVYPVVLRHLVNTRVLKRTLKVIALKDESQADTA